MEGLLGRAESDCAFSGGVVKAYPEDFVVEEVWGDRVFTVRVGTLNRIRDRLVLWTGKKEYVHFTLVKRDWTTVKALQYLARRLRVSLKRFGYSGMKDKRAISAQRVSLWRTSAEELANVRLKDIWIKDLSYSDERITLGNCAANRFTITIRDIPHEAAVIREKLKRFSVRAAIEGIPNFFGQQRLGRERENVEVGQAIVKGDLELATEIILRKTEPYLESGGIEALPDVFWTEKRVLQHLRDHPNDHAGALRRIPKKILWIYTHAIQSDIFNIQLREAIAGGRLPEVIEVRGFRVEKMPELSTHSFSRKSRLSMRDFEILSVIDTMAKIGFTLGSGEYATILLSYLILGNDATTEGLAGTLLSR